MVTRIFAAMPEFLTPVDIGNRALQHCGSEMMITGFSEVSKAARQVSFAYGKQRRAELMDNIWTFATREAALRPIDTTTMRVRPALWVSSTTYYRGCIVDDGTGTLWMSRVQNNLNNQPQSSLSQWEPYFGPLTADLWDTTDTTAYRSGELVYTTAGDGTYRVYQSQIDGNSDNPSTATTWDATVTYATAQTVTYLSVVYQSLIDLNLNQTPSSAPAAWAVGTTYSTGQHVYNPTDGLIYSSIGNGNVGNNPATDGGIHWTNTGVLCPWTTVFVGGTGDIQWLEIGGAEFPNGVGLTTLNILYPVGAGPSSQSWSKNVFRLPAAFLRQAPQDPKRGSFSALGAPGGAIADDWQIENEFLVTRTATVIIFRFVADIQDVTRMTDLFCEGLAARLGKAVCEPLTNSTAKLAAISGAYKDVIARALQVDAIEVSSIEPPLDDWIACRL